MFSSQLMFVEIDEPVYGGQSGWDGGGKVGQIHILSYTNSPNLLSACPAYTAHWVKRIPQNWRVSMQNGGERSLRLCKWAAQRCVEVCQVCDLSVKIGACSYTWKWNKETRRGQIIAACLLFVSPQLDVVLPQYGSTHSTFCHFKMSKFDQNPVGGICSTWRDKIPDSVDIRFE